MSEHWQQGLLVNKSASTRTPIADASSETLAVLQKTLVERGANYTDIADNSEVFCNLLTSMGFQWPPNMTDTQAHCLCNIATKLARLKCGDFQHLDSLLDLAGYAILMHADTQRNQT